MFAQSLRSAPSQNKRAARNDPNSFSLRTMVGQFQSTGQDVQSVKSISTVGIQQNTSRVVELMEVITSLDRQNTNKSANPKSLSKNRSIERLNSQRSRQSPVPSNSGSYTQIHLKKKAYLSKNAPGVVRKQLHQKHRSWGNYRSATSFYSASNDLKVNESVCSSHQDNPVEVEETKQQVRYSLTPSKERETTEEQERPSLTTENVTKSNELYNFVLTP